MPFGPIYFHRYDEIVTAVSCMVKFTANNGFYAEKGHKNDNVADHIEVFRTQFYSMSNANIS